MTGIDQHEPPSSRGLWIAVVAFGALLNPLMLAGPLFMLQVYERVLPSGSGPTLLVLFALVAFVYAVMALLDAARARLMLRIGARMQAGLERRVILARSGGLVRDPPDPGAARALDDLDSVQRALTSPALLALFDTPWAFVFLALLFLFHPAMGALALAGGAGLVALGAWSRWRQRAWQVRAAEATHEAEALARVLDEEADALAALGMGGALARDWQARRGRARASALQAADRQAFDAAAGRAFRLFMQSAILALGGWLVLRGQLSPGLIVAASVLMGRALMPVEQMSAQWAQLRAARAGWARLQRVLSAAPDPGDAPVRVGGALEIRGLVVARPGGGPLLRLDGIRVAPGRALGVIGPSGAGKSLLARALLGTAPLAAGRVILGSDPLPGPVAAGYLPQRAVLFDGTVAQNIARFDPSPDPTAIERAARLTGLHAHVLALPRGYETRVARRHPRLAEGVVQRLALARAVYGVPPLIVLDEPGAHLDAEGMAALDRAIRGLKAEGAVLVVLSQRPAGIAACDDLVVLEAGAQVAYGPRDEVLRAAVRNHTGLAMPPAQEAAG